MLNTVILGDALRIIPTMPTGSIHAVITDPPYSSGGLHVSERRQTTTAKYIATAVKSDYARHAFLGDSLDQRSWTSWMAEWLSLAREATTPGGVAAVFSDWRQLPSLTDALQHSGWLWRGVLVWDKKNARPQPGRPRQQCEFIAWASNGPLGTKRDAPFLPGLFSHSPPTGPARLHQTEKPLNLMRELVRLCVRGGTILDPFAGSGSTLAAAVLEDYNYIGIEKDTHYAEVAKQRVRETYGLRLFRGGV